MAGQTVEINIVRCGDGPCSPRCDFYQPATQGRPDAGCKLHFNDGRYFPLCRPGEDCPGPGRYKLVSAPRPDESPNHAADLNAAHTQAFGSCQALGLDTSLLIFRDPLGRVIGGSLVTTEPDVAEDLEALEAKHAAEEGLSWEDEL